MLLSSFFPLLALFASPALAAFSATTAGSTLTVDTDGGLVFQLSTATGDIISMVYGGKELQSSAAKNTHIASGFGQASVTSNVSGSTILVTVTSSNISPGEISQYYAVKKGDPTIYMYTYAPVEPSVGELRFIARLSKSVVPNGPKESNVQGCSTVVEGSDVFKCSDGRIVSKFYSSNQFINDKVHGVTGSGIGAWIVIGETGYEKSSGGPFFRDIDNQGTDQQEVYFYMNSNHEQTEVYRTGLFGPYALVVNSGSTPSPNLNFDFLSGLSIKGLVPASQRGRAWGKASGIPSSFSSKITVSWSNPTAQYWVKASSDGSFTSPPMLPGAYTQTLYKSELAVATSSVVVSAGQTASSSIASRETAQAYIFSIGEADGTPAGFLNADKIERAHPSDSRMATWGPVTYTVGTSSPSAFPMAQFKNANNPTTIYFNVTAAELGARTLEIGTTSSFAGGRPQATINSFSGPNPTAPTEVKSRGVTRGTYRGNNQVYSVSIPAGTIVEGRNKIVINVISGSSGDAFLSPNVVYDFVRLY